MAPSTINQSRFASRMMDLLVLTLSFLLFVFLLDIKWDAQVAVDLVFYVAVVFVCLRLARRAIFEYVHYSKRVINIVLGNVSGLIAGVVLVAVCNQFISGIAEHLLVVILSSVLAFFILGTLSPLVKASHLDRIIHH